VAEEKKEKTDINLPFFKIKENEEGSYVKVGPIEVTDKKGEEEKVKIGPLRISDSGVRIEQSLKSRLEGMAWAAFFILLGCVFLFESVYHYELPGVAAIGIGVILLSLNYARTRLNIEPSTFTIVLGLLAIAYGVSQWFVEEINVFALILIAIGIYLIITFGRKS